jgi:hypothetical protein
MAAPQGRDRHHEGGGIVQTPMTSSDTELPTAPQGEGGAGRKPGRRAIVLLTAALGTLIVAGGIIALLTLGGGDGQARPEDLGDDGQVPPETIGNGAPAVEPASNVTAIEAEAKPFAVRLDWVAPEGEVEALVVLRDGARVGRLDPGETTFLDRSALPATRYSYVVQSVRDGEFVRSEPLRVKTPPAPLSLARLDGVYAIDARSTSHFGFTGVADEFASGWRFRPVCRRGPCSVTFKDVQGNPISGRLERTRARYEGAGSSKFGTCGNVTSTGTFTLRLEVVRAKTVRDAWRASKLVGTFVERVPAQLGCVGAGVDFDITAKLMA